MEEAPMKLSIEDVVAKAEEVYRNEVKWKAPDTYETALEKVKKDILKLQKIAKDEFKKDLSIPDVIHEIMSVKGHESISEDSSMLTTHLSILAGYQLEQERQKEKENKQDLEAMVRLVLEELVYFSLPPGSAVTVMSVGELEEAIRQQKMSRNKSLLKLFFLSSWIYFPLSLPFIILKMIWLICVLIRPAIKEVKKLDMSQAQNLADVDLKKLNFKAILGNAEKKMPKIMDIEYFGHHIVCGILLWLIILKWVF